MQNWTIALCIILNIVCNSSLAETLTIFNAARHPVVIGIYEYAPNGVRETLIDVESMTAIQNVPIELCENQCFAIAYRATLDQGHVKRDTPVAIVGMARLPAYSREKSDATTKDDKVTLLYNNPGGDLSFAEQDVYGQNLQSGRRNSDRIAELVQNSYGDRIRKIDYDASEEHGRTKR